MPKAFPEEFPDEFLEEVAKVTEGSLGQLIGRLATATAMTASFEAIEGPTPEETANAEISDLLQADRELLAERLEAITRWPWKAASGLGLVSSWPWWTNLATIQRG